MAGTMLRSAPRQSTHDVAPAAPSVVSISRATRRRPSWILLGSLLVGVAALLGAWVFTSTSERTAVVVAARDIQPGEVLDAADLRVVEIGGGSGLRAVQSSQQHLIVGRAARGPIPAGTVLNTDLFADRGQTIPAGMVVVGASLTAGAAPTAGLRAGDRVEVLGVARTTASPPSPDGIAAPEASHLTSGTVWSVESTSSTFSGPLWVAIAVPESSQGAVAQAAADGLLRLALVGAG